MATHDSVPAMFMHDLASLAMYTAAVLPDDVELGLNMVPGTYVHSARQQLVDSLVAQGVTHILWVDTDMRFPRDALIRLLKHQLPVVGINYAKRGVPTDFVAIKTCSYEEGIDSVRLETNEDSTGLEEVDAIGFGMVLMHVSALANMPDPRKEPWFWFEWIEEKQQQVGEDVRFCRLLREAGNLIWVDHDLSKECAHVGLFEYRCAHAEEQRRVELGPMVGSVLEELAGVH